MIQKTWLFICEHGHAFMLAGMGVICVGAFMLVHARQTVSAGGAISWPIVIAGVGVYVLGRIGVAFRGRRAGKTDEDTGE